MPSTSETLAVAIQHHQAGRLAEAEQIYRQILQVQPDHAEALHLLGLVAHQSGRQEMAAEYITRAIGIRGTEAAFHNNLGEVYRALHRIADAVACYRRAVQLQPKLAEAHNNLGIALRDLGSAEEAVAACRRALDLRPDYAEAHNNLANALRDLGRLEQAMASYRRALELKPHYAEAHGNLGGALKDQGQLDAAVACYRRAIQLNPGYTQAHNNLGNILRRLGRLDEAVACYRRALALEPQLAEAHNNLGTALLEQGRPDEAAASARQALELKPDLAAAHASLGHVLKDQGYVDEALACYRRALALQPGLAEVHSELLFTQLLCADCDALALADQCRQWNQLHAAPLAATIRPHLNDRRPDRRLRVGYISPDFRNHPVGLFMLPLLEAHDRRNVEITCYASVFAADELTDRCRARAGVWRDVRGLSDEQLADMVRQDRIDILVDLAMHTAGNRLLVLARKPAPVQVTYLAYCGTTGLDAIDYRLTDPYLDPPDGAARVAQGDPPCYSEESVRLPETYWCYRPAIDTPAVSALPALAAGHVTFGCLNSFCKVTAPTLAAWSRLLQAVPGSTLLLSARAGSHRRRVEAFLAGQGIEPPRLAFVDRLLLTPYFNVYHRIDVALDPFPYGGGTTTCDALWMGVPVVSLAGDRAMGRAGVSILSNVGLPELVAADVEGYVRIAAGLAGDLPRLAQLRAAMRRRMESSPLMDAARLARGVEAAYRVMWRRWCEGVKN